MEILLKRLWPSDTCIIGTMFIDGASSYFTLELPEKYLGNANVQDKTCIPIGTYPVIRTWSNHFGCMMPHVENVEGREAIEIHYGNFPHDVLGCILVGNKRISDCQIGDSRSAFESFMDTFDNALAAAEHVNITIE